MYSQLVYIAKYTPKAFVLPLYCTTTHQINKQMDIKIKIPIHKYLFEIICEKKVCGVT